MIECQTISKFNGQGEREGLVLKSWIARHNEGCVRRNKECVGFAIRPSKEGKCDFPRRAT
jgi:hypothetical protein